MNFRLPVLTAHIGRSLRDVTTIERRNDRSVSVLQGTVDDYIAIVSATDQPVHASPRPINRFTLEGTMTVQVPHADYTPVSTMSLRELRAQMLQRAAVMAARARACRARGDLRGAHLLELRAEQMARAARSVNVS